MKTITGAFCTALTFCFTLFTNCGYASSDITIIRNGGGANLIENTLVATTVSVSQGADYLEFPVNMSADDHLVAFKDTTLNRLTDVADVFPTKHREDGNYYVVDFSLSELRQLRLSNVFEEDSRSLSLGIPTLKEELTLIRSLNSLLDKNTGIVITLVEPGFYSKEGKNVSGQLQQTLHMLSYSPEDKLFIECADPDELQKISRWARSKDGGSFSLIQQIQLKQNIGEEQFDTSAITYQHDWLFTNSGLRILASYANTVAIPREMVQENSTEVDNILLSLRNYGIKIFLQPKNSRALNDFSHSDMLMNQGGLPQIDAEFDGIYIDSKDVTAANNENSFSVPVSTPTTDIQINQSALPPFFSNLGLSQPNNTNNSIDSKPTGDKISEELE
jgi:glycerophosphoryl diester phosphodiesterase